MGRDRWPGEEARDSRMVQMLGCVMPITPIFPSGWIHSCQAMATGFTEGHWMVLGMMCMI